MFENRLFKRRGGKGERVNKYGYEVHDFGSVDGECFGSVAEGGEVRVLSCGVDGDYVFGGSRELGGEDEDFALWMGALDRFCNLS
jgi:hypothetical protein